MNIQRFSLFLLLLFGVTCVTYGEIPKVSYGGITCKGPVSDEELNSALATFHAKKYKPRFMTLTLEKVDNETLTRICEKCSEARSLYLSKSPELSGLAPLAKLKYARVLVLRRLPQKLDCSPIGKMREVRNLTLDQVGMTNNDLTFLSPLQELTTLSAEKLPKKISLKGLESLPKLKRLSLIHLSGQSLNPLAACGKVGYLNLRYSEVDDLAPIGEMESLEEVDFYGAKLRDFTPLAKAPKLEQISYYAVKMPTPESFQTLGSLKQVKRFHGGLTQMRSLQWVKNVPQIRELKTFAEKITDFTPIASARDLVYFRAWNMTIGDLSFLSKLSALKKLELPGSSFSNLKALSELEEVMSIDLSRAKPRIDLSFFQKFDNLEILTLSSCKVDHLEILPKLPKLERLNITKVEGELSLETLKSCPKLKVIYASKSRFSKEQAENFKQEMKTQKRRINLFVS